MTLSGPRRTILVVAAVVLAGAWGIAVVGARWAKASRMTAEKVGAYLTATDLRHLDGAARAQAIRGLIDRLNALSFEERRRVRLERKWESWFDAMTPGEQGEFLEGTMPTGLKQVLTAFEEMPEQNRRVAIEDAVKRLQEAQHEVEADAPAGSGDEAGGEPPELDPAVQKRMIETGLKAYYSTSSARSKAELAPLLEEIQRTMESGRLFRRRRPPGGGARD